MRILLLIGVLFLLQPLYGLDLKTLRDMYQKAANDEKVCLNMMHILENPDNQDQVAMAYKASATMIMAGHIKNPIKALQLFREGQHLLEKCISAQPHSLELHYLRFSIQSQAPQFLGYRSDLEKDKEILIHKTNNSTDIDLVSRIKTYLLTCSCLTQTELNQLRNG